MWEVEQKVLYWSFVELLPSTKYKKGPFQALTNLVFCEAI